MKLAQLELENRSFPAVLTEDGQAFHSFESLGLSQENLMALVMKHPEEDMKKLREAAKTPGTPLTGVRFLAPLRKLPQDMICLGINYMEHAEESARFHKEDWDGKREQAVYFSKRIHETTDPEALIPRHAELTDAVDYEAELAVVLGKEAKNVKAENAANYVFGYTIINDVSARDVQNAHKQWYFGKSLDGFTPMGPVLVTADEFSFPPKLDIESRVNGEVRQHSNTDKQIFKIDYVLEELSVGMTLECGTVIATGTPSGVGMGFNPPKYLHSGDTVECEIEGIGVLRNRLATSSLL